MKKWWRYYCDSCHRKIPVLAEGYRNQPFHFCDWLCERTYGNRFQPAPERKLGPEQLKREEEEAEPWQPKREEEQDNTYDLPAWPLVASIPSNELASSGSFGGAGASEGWTEENDPGCASRLTEAVQETVEVASGCEVDNSCGDGESRSSDDSAGDSDCGASYDSASSSACDSGTSDSGSYGDSGSGADGGSY